jgi:myo-inositol-1(or 4)-monophosphatase
VDADPRRRRPAGRGIRRFGSAALDLAWVAAGATTVLGSDLKPGTPPPAACCARGGGFVTDYRGRSLPICGEQVSPANDRPALALHKLVAGALKAEPA